MSYKDHRIDVASKIMAGFAANPAVFASNDRNGWQLVNCSNFDLAAYAVKLADELITANELAGPPTADTGAAK